ncbi:glycoside hydrolase family 55 protein [Clostridium tyrobutyricum]|uniref:glycoside hydrolase family 55 protein n=1 Tax=Clostridium tyrobutyricum TaxID=1519 RepID=UPI001C39018E|nr:glycoside hydrolase family 55 protein [Clostridium tyrobutyricum]MBV4422915.1 glycoside hydrolase family 55 protein [Clostridium tyrobutyricum]
MEDLIKGELDWHNKVNSNFHEVDSQMADIAVFASSFWVNGYTNWSPAIQSALDYIKNNGGIGTVYLPGGVLNCDANIKTYSKIKIKGQGIGKTTLRANNIAVTILLSNYNSSDSYIELEDFSIDCNMETTGMNCTGFSFSNISYSKINKVHVFHSNVVMALIVGNESTSHDNIVDKCIFDTTKILAGNDCLALGSSNTIVSNSIFIGAGDTGIGGQWGQSKPHYNVTVYNCSFINCNLGFACGPLATNIIKIYDCFFSGNSCNIWIIGCDDIKITNNTFNDTTKSDAGNIRLDINTNLDVGGNTFYATATNIIYVSAVIAAFGGSVFPGISKYINIHDNIIYGSGTNSGVAIYSNGNSPLLVNGGNPTTEQLALGTTMKGVSIVNNNLTDSCKIKLVPAGTGNSDFSKVQIKNNINSLGTSIFGNYTDASTTNTTVSSLDTDIIGSMAFVSQYDAIPYWFRTVFISYTSEITMQRQLIKDGFNGQRMTIINNGSPTITIQDDGQNAPYNSNIKLKDGAISLALKSNDILELIFNSATGLWYQI